MRIAQGTLVALIAAGAMATTASASVDSAGGYKFTQKTYEIKPGKTERISTMCPKNTHVYGGGQSNPTGYNQFAQLQEYPIDGRDKDKTPDDGFEVQVHNASGGPVESKVFASCGKPKATYEVKKAKLFAGGVSGEIDATCPDNKPGSLVGGGVRGPNKIVHEDGGPSVGTPPFYYAYMHNDGSKDAKASVYAICAKVKTTYLQNSEDVLSHTQGEALVQCADDMVMLDGGMGSTGGVSLNSSHPSDDLSYRYWYVFGDNTLANTSSMTVFAVCAKHP